MGPDPALFASFEVRGFAPLSKRCLVPLFVGVRVHTQPEVPEAAGFEAFRCPGSGGFQ